MLVHRDHPLAIIPRCGYRKGCPEQLAVVAGASLGPLVSVVRSVVKVWHM